MRDGAEKAQTVREPAQKLHDPPVYPEPSCLHIIEHPKHVGYGNFIT